MTRLAIALPLLALTGCLVESLPEEGARLELSIGMPHGRTPSADFTPWDSQGLFHLEKFPKLVKVTVETKDYVLASGTWPDPERGIGDGEKANGEVGVDLDIPAGPARRLRGLGFVVPLDKDEAVVYREEKPLELDLVAGKSTESILQMVPHEVGAAELTVRCELGNTGKWQPFQAALVDARAFVLYPPGPLKENEVGSLKVSFQRVPIGRPHWVRVTVSNGTQTMVVEQRKPTFTLATVGELRPVEVTLPCQDL